MTGELSAQARVFDFKVDYNERIAQDVFLMRFTSDVACLLKAGQFMNFSVPGDASEILRIPLSFKKCDADVCQVWIEYAVVGNGTRRLSTMKAGDASTLIGPCGNGWHLPEIPGRCLLVSGGIGAPPIVACARMLTEAGIGFDAIVGAHTAAKKLSDDLDVLRLLSSDGFSGCERSVVFTTDDGTAGRAGFVTEPASELLSGRAYACVYTCGPLPMMAAVSKLAEDAGVACQASLERVMGCGFGACSCCNVELKDGSQALCCLDGPVFDAKEVVW